MKPKIVILIFFVCAISKSFSQSQCDNNCFSNDCYKAVYYNDTYLCDDDPYVLIFEDNFDGNTLDLQKWNIIEEVPRDFNFDNQKAWHTANNIEVSNGTLKIISKKLSTPYIGTWVTDWETVPPTTKTANFDYTTGEITSKYQFGYGKYEIRCKLVY